MGLMPFFVCDGERRAPNYTTVIAKGGTSQVAACYTCSKSGPHPAAECVGRRPVRQGARV